MYDFVVVEIDECFQELEHVELDLGFAQPLLPLEQIVESVIGAQFEQDIHVEIVLEGVLKLHDVGVVQCLVNLYFADQLNYFYTTFCFDRGFVKLHF